MEILEGILYMMWRGLAIGVIISAPMGPVGILCVQRTLEKGRYTGFFTGVGAAASDLFYCLLTGFGLSFIEDFLKANQNVIQVIGSVVLVVFGVYLFKSNPSRTLRKPDAARSSHRRDILQGFLFTFSNPLIIFLIIGLFARFNFLLPEISLPHYITGYAFIFIGALLWWWIVSYFIDKVRSHFNLRSMWLINKIIGCIIMVFAVVGIVTAVSGMASADTRPPLYMNSVRGFGPLGEAGDSGGPLMLDNASCDTLVRFLPLDRAEEFSFSFRAANVASARSSVSRHAGRDGRMVRVAYPSWGIVARGTGKTLVFSFSTSYETGDDLFPPRLRITAAVDGVDAASCELADGIDPFDGVNSFRLVFDGAALRLSGGNRTFSPLLDVGVTGLSPDSIGLYAAPGAKLVVDNAVLSVSSERTRREDADISEFADSGVRTSYFSRSVDPVEGEWAIFDRMFDDSQLRPGGDYRLALVAADGGYDVIYLSGATVNKSLWVPGMIKGFLRPSDFSDIYEMRWIDPAGSPLDGEIKVQFVHPDILDVRFVGHDSAMRLRKIIDNEK